MKLWFLCPQGGRHKYQWNGQQERNVETCQKCKRRRYCDDPWDLWERDQR